MTYAPATLLEVRAFLKGKDADLQNAELGITGGPSHVLTGTSYHLGGDQLKMGKNPYSARTRRDLAGLADPEISNAACALDIDDDLDDLRVLSTWLVNECRAGAADTLDIREIIYSPDGITVWTWDREQGRTSLPQRRGDSSHRTHTHISFYRDSTRRPKVGLFRRFYTSKRKAITMFFLQVTGNDQIYISDGQHTRAVPGGQWDLTCVPLINAGVPLLAYPDLVTLLAAGGPLRTEAQLPPIVEVTVPQTTLQVQLDGKRI